MNVEPDDLSPKAAQLLSASNDERIAYLLSDHWEVLAYPIAERIMGALEMLLSRSPRDRMMSAAIIGPAGNGKTMLTKTFYKRHQPYTIPDEDYVRVPVLMLELPSYTNIDLFYGTILSGLGVTFSKRAKLAERHFLVKEFAAKVGLRMLIIDEFHELMDTRGDKQREMLSTIKYLSNELKISYIITGVKEAHSVLISEAQIASRFEPYWLPAWTLNEDYLTLLASFEAQLPLRKRSDLSQEHIAQIILARSGGTIGEIALLIERATLMAIESGSEKITKTILDRVQHKSPDQRRRDLMMP